jgi:UDP-N-acetyl-D-mannosaminuronic acid transferase (WecB/TagA/CpsF family)
VRERVNLLNIVVDKIKTEEVIREIFEAIEKGEKKTYCFC